MGNELNAEEPESSVDAGITAAGFEVRFGRGLAEVSKARKVALFGFALMCGSFLGLFVFVSIDLASVTPGSLIVMVGGVLMLGFTIWQLTHLQRQHQGVVTVTESAVETSLARDPYADLRREESDTSSVYPQFRQTIERDDVERLSVHKSQMSRQLGYGQYEVRVVSMSGVESVLATNRTQGEAEEITNHVGVQLGLDMGPTDSAAELARGDG